MSKGTKKNYEISLSPNYVHTWGIKEAIRELLQNAIDGDKCGYDKYIYYDSNDRKLYISNVGITLDVSTLVLGCSAKQDDDDLIGHYGEGYKLALLVLLRNNRNVTIHNGTRVWIPSFRKSSKFKTTVLNINETINEDLNDDDLTFILHNVNMNEYKELVEYFPCMTDDYGKTVATDNGTILLDKRFSGKMFVEGLYVQSDSNFKYGYNFKASVVNLDRDRKAINYYALRQLTAAAVITAEHCYPEIFKAISDSYTDIKDIEDVLDEASDKFLKEYRDMLYRDKGLEEDTIIATDAVAKQLRQMDIDTPIAKGTEIESYLVAKANDKLGLIYEAKDRVEKRDREDDLWDDLIYSKFRAIMEWYVQFRDEFPQEAIDSFEHDLSPKIEPSCYDQLKKYIPDDCSWTEDELIEIQEASKNQT